MITHTNPNRTCARCGLGTYDPATCATIPGGGWEHAGVTAGVLCGTIVTLREMMDNAVRDYHAKHILFPADFLAEAAKSPAHIQRCAVATKFEFGTCGHEGCRAISKKVTDDYCRACVAALVAASTEGRLP
jgi:hypothetical protein